MYTLKIECTREHLEKSKWCSIDPTKHAIKGVNLNTPINNCWIASAVNDIFPFAQVSDRIDPPDLDNLDSDYWHMMLPEKARNMIQKFDQCETVKERLELKPFSFEVEIDDETLDLILKYYGYDIEGLFSKITEINHLNLVYEKS